jgi:hypothetical protein
MVAKKKIYKVFKSKGKGGFALSEYDTKRKANEDLLNRFNKVYFTDFPTLQLAEKYGELDIFKDGTGYFIDQYKGEFYYIKEF